MATFCKGDTTWPYDMTPIGQRVPGGCSPLASLNVGTPDGNVSRLNTQPAPAPVNASHPPLRGNRLKTRRGRACDSGGQRDNVLFTDSRRCTVAEDFHPQHLADLSRCFSPFFHCSQLECDTEFRFMLSRSLKATSKWLVARHLPPEASLARLGLRDL